MPAFVISDVEPLDPELLREYRSLAEASIARHGGRYIVRGGAIESLEGGWSPQHIVIVAFPTLEQARAWYESSDYAEALRVRRQGALRRRLVLVDGEPG
ncbi:MAG TPA: DUF1330 domain-containing protein [Stellaceae bacterium]|nr:DUF1330 domain-containing protein [Stellaceae bacterium]